VKFLFTITVFWLGATTLAAAEVADVATDAGEIGKTTDTFARPIERESPRYPRLAQRRGQEGWVDVSYVVQPDGSVTDPIVDASSGILAFEESALEVVTKWKFEPATRNGKAIEQCQTKTRLVFAFEGPPAGARSSFIGFYKKAKKLIANGGLEEAASFIEKQREKGKWNLYEYAQLSLLAALIAHEQGDEQAQLLALYRTGGKSGQYIDKKLANMVLPVILSLELKLGKYSAALETYDVMKKSPKLLKKNDQLVTAVEELADNIQNSETTLSISGEIPEHAGRMIAWSYRPLRREFAFYNINGELNEFELRCDWKRFRDDAGKEASWKIPESWGECNLYVYGDIGTTFQFVEYPEEVADHSRIFSISNHAVASSFQ